MSTVWLYLRCLFSKKARRDLERQIDEMYAGMFRGIPAEQQYVIDGDGYRLARPEERWR